VSEYFILTSHIILKFLDYSHAVSSPAVTVAFVLARTNSLGRNTNMPSVEGTEADALIIVGTRFWKQ
jgi:hypothetical protein